MANTFGSVLKQIMKEKKITHAALARAIGCHRTTITDYANDKYLPSEETFHRIHQVITDKALYDAFFAAVKPKERKNKDLISEGKAYNYFTAKEENISTKEKESDLSENEDNLIKAAASVPEDEESAKKFVDSLSESDKKYIAHAIVFILAHFDEHGFNVLAPDAYAAYQNLYNNIFSKYVSLEAYL